MNRKPKSNLKLPDWLYDILKWLCILGLPALSAMYSTLAHIWGLPFAEQIPATISAVGLFLGTVLGISSAEYKRVQQNAEGGGSHDGNHEANGHA